MKKLLFLLAMIFTLVSCSSTTNKKDLVQKYSLDKESAHNWETVMPNVMMAEATNPDWYGEDNPLISLRKQGKMSEREYYFLDYLGKTPANEITDDEFDRFAKILTSFVNRTPRKFILEETNIKDPKGLVDYINDELSQIIIELTGLSQNMPQITQNIENNYGTTSAVGNGSISSVNTISMDNDSIEKLCSDVLSELIKSNFLSNDDKEVVIDDVETIQSEMSSSNPKKIKIKKAWISIQAILHKIPTGITVATQLMDLCDRVSQQFSVP